MSAKKNLTIRLDSQLRDKLEFIAEREFRTLANQITVFLINGVNSYLKANEQANDDYLNHLIKTSHSEDSASDSDIPF